jgi:putative heme transporter
MSAADEPRHLPVALEHGRRRVRLPQLAIALCCLVGLAAVLAAEHDELAKALAAIAHAKPSLLIGAVGCEWLSMIAFARLQRWLLRVGDLTLTIDSVLAITFAGNALSVSVPIAGAGLGAAFTYRELERRKVMPAPAAFVPVMSGIASTVSLMVIVAGGALVSGNEVAGVLGLLGAVLILAAIFGVLLAVRIPALARLVERLAVAGVRLIQHLKRRPSEPPSVVVARAREGLASLHLRKRDGLVAFGLALLNWLGDAGCLALSIRATGLPVPLHKLLLAWAAGQAAGSLGFTPGGLGVVEVALVAALVGIGLPAAGATAAVLIYRLISLWLVLLVGWIVFLFMRSRRTETETPGVVPRSGQFVPVARSVVTAEEITGVLRTGLGPRFHVRLANTPRDSSDELGSDRPERIVIRRVRFPLFRAEIRVIRRPEGTFLHVMGGGFTPSTRISNRLGIVRKVRALLRTAPNLR